MPDDDSTKALLERLKVAESQFPVEKDSYAGLSQPRSEQETEEVLKLLHTVAQVKVWKKALADNLVPEHMRAELETKCELELLRVQDPVLADAVLRKDADRSVEEAAERLAVEAKKLVTNAKKKRGRKPDLLAQKRRKVIQVISETGVAGEDYCREMGKAGLQTPTNWQRNEGCPASYTDAWNHRADALKWRQRIAEEKSRATSEY
jgi:hypothetical protein